MGNLFGVLESGDFILLLGLLMFAECVCLWFWWLKTGSGIAPVAVVVNSLAGGFLMFALYLALTDKSVQSIAVCLFAAFIFHVLDLLMRWRLHNNW